MLECSWHRGRGAVVCPSTLGVPTAAVEARVPEAISGAPCSPPTRWPTPPSARSRRSRRRGRHSTRLALRKELEAFTAQREALIDYVLAGYMEKEEGGARLKASLERKRALQRRLAEAEAQAVPFDPVALRPVIEATLTEIHAALAGDPTERREALRALLGAERLRGYPAQPRVELQWRAPLTSRSARLQALREVTLDQRCTRLVPRWRLKGPGGVGRVPKNPRAIAAPRGRNQKDLNAYVPDRV